MSNVAPHGYSKSGKPLAPYGYTKKGTPRKTPPGTKKVYSAPSTAVYRPRVAGHGDYRTYLRKATSGWASRAGSYLGGAAGGAIGSYIAPGIGTSTGASIGSDLGRRAGNRFREITGYGDYQINQNTVMFPSQAAMIPSFGEDEIRVKKREIIGHIDMSQAFSNNLYRINASDPQTFPWLSRIALNYQQYRFNGLVFEYKSTSSVAIASSTDLALGQVMMATNYDVVEGKDGFVDDIQLLGSFFSNSGRASENIMHAIECAPKDQPTKWLYTRNGAPQGTTDDRLYDVGMFNLATQGAQSDYDNAGMLYVTYDVSFQKSIQNNQLGLALNSTQWENTLVSAVDKPLANMVIRPGSYFPMGVSSQNTLVFPREISSGFYEIIYELSGLYASGVSFTTDPIMNNCEVVDRLPNGSGTVFIIFNGTTAGRVVFVVKVTGTNATFRFADLSATTSSGTASGHVWVNQINGSIYL